MGKALFDRDRHERAGDTDADADGEREQDHRDRPGHDRAGEPGEADESDCRRYGEA